MVPPWAMTPNPAVESPKAKRSGGKGGHHRSSGHSSNTSTPKHPDSTSARKPSCSKEPALNEQENSPSSHGSHKHGHSPSPSAESVRCKQKEVHTEDTCALNSILPMSSSTFDGFHSPTGSHSNVNELQPPSIISTPLGLGTPQQWQTTSEESRHSLASLYTSQGFNFPGYPAAGSRQSHFQCPQPHRIPPHVEYLARQCVHLWAILSSPDYQPGQQPV